MPRYTKILNTKAMNKISKDSTVRQQVYRKSKRIFDLRKQKMLEDFKNHPVTREIEDGPEASNISNTIFGKGNLYSFIGFRDGERPADRVYSLLDAGTKLSAIKPRVQKVGNRLYMGFRVKVPSEGELARVSRMPWEPGSWLFKIERGISGLGYYIYEKYIKSSRSGTGAQAGGKVRPGSYKATKYMSAILRTFKRNFKK
jgi:hypothetical protein